VHAVAVHSRGWRTAHTAVAWVVLGELTASAQSAQIEPIRLTYRSYEGCPTEWDFVEGVRARTYRARPAVGDEPARAFAVELRADGSKSRGVLRITGLGGEVTSREVAGDTCEEVVSALTLITALAIDPQASISGSSAAASSKDDASSSAPVAEKATDTAVHPAPESSPPQRSPARGLRWFEGFEGQTLTGILPEWGVGGGLFVEALDQRAGIFAPSYRASVLITGASATFADGVGAHVLWILARLELCPVRFPLQDDSVALGVCAGLDGGMLRSEGTGLPHPGTEIRPWFAPVSVGRVTWNLPGGLSVEGSGGITVPLERYGFDYQRGALSVNVSQAPALGAVATLGAGYRFP
jgi:hypothetical protein